MNQYLHWHRHNQHLNIDLKKIKIKPCNKSVKSHQLKVKSAKGDRHTDYKARL